MENYNSEFYDKIYRKGGSEKSYSKHYSKSQYFELWSYIINNWLKDPENHNIFDIGCGVGQFASMLHDHEDLYCYTGVDFSQVAIEKAKARKLPVYFLFFAYPIEWWIGRNLFGNYDTYMALEVLEHMPEEVEMSLLRSIPAGKTVILSLPDFMADGHFRVYPDTDFIYNRYADILEITEMKTFVVNPITNAKVIALKAFRKPVDPERSNKVIIHGVTFYRMVIDQITFLWKPHPLFSQSDMTAQIKDKHD